MTVQELIDKLSEMPRDLIVVRAGYEGGVAEVTVLSKESIKLHVNSEWYYGPHEIAPYRNSSTGKTEDGDIDAVYIG